MDLAEDFTVDTVALRKSLRTLTESFDPLELADEPLTLERTLTHRPWLASVPDAVRDRSPRSKWPAKVLDKNFSTIGRTRKSTLPSNSIIPGNSATCTAAKLPLEDTDSCEYFHTVAATAKSKWPSRFSPVTPGVMTIPSAYKSR
jgi:hypothetical protein